jgi:hypothetical protein
MLDSGFKVERFKLAPISIRLAFKRLPLIPPYLAIKVPLLLAL